MSQLDDGFAAVRAGNCVFLWIFYGGGWLENGWTRVWSQKQPRQHPVIAQLPRLCDRLGALRAELGPGAYCYGRAYDYAIDGAFHPVGNADAVASVGPRTLADWQNGRDCLAAGIPA